MKMSPALVLSIAALLSGCAATVTRDAPAAAAGLASPQAARQLVLEPSAAGSIGAGPDWEAFVEEWDTAMTAATAGKGATFKLKKPGDAPPADPAVLVKMKVNDFRYVSQAKRYAVGIFAGNAFMDIEVEFVELPEGRSLGTRRYQTSSSAWQGVFSAMTPKQVEAVAKEIVAELAGR